MQILENQLYHVYNQGNNHEILFIDRNDYIEFLKKYKEILADKCETVCYCLMPNHFHFLINSTTKSAAPVYLGSLESTELSNGFRLLCSGYAHYFNKKYRRSGSLFRQKTKAKNVESSGENYPFICFNYIHQNPMVAGLCEKMEDWEFSSYRDYCGLRKGSLVNKSIAYNLVGVNEKKFYEESYQVICEEKYINLYL